MEGEIADDINTVKDQLQQDTIIITVDGLQQDNNIISDDENAPVEDVNN